MLQQDVLLLSKKYLFLPTDPFNAPDSFDLEALTSSSINVTAGPISQGQNGYIILYNFYYAEANRDGNTVVGDWTEITSPERSVVITGLGFFSYYAFKASGATIYGSGPNSTVTFGRTLEDCKYFVFDFTQLSSVCNS